MDHNPADRLCARTEAYICGEIEVQLAQEVLDQNMGITDVKTVFRARAGDKLDLGDAELRYTGNKQTLTLTGQFPDGAPFEFKTAPFDGDPVSKAKQIATDLTMPAASSISNLTSEVRSIFQMLTQRAAGMREVAKEKAGDAVKALDLVEGAIGEMSAATAELQSVVGGESNGGPDGPLPGSE